ncbi:D-amino-acid transaminase [bacterium]|nr:D-amino-acid transaminase [bacterium]
MNIDFYIDRFVEPGRPMVPIEDRGYQFGDGIYEVIRAYDGVPFMVEEHLFRLERSAAAIHLQLPFPRERISEIIDEALTRSGIPNAIVYFQISRGSAPRKHQFPKVDSVMALTVRPASPPPREKYSEGISATLLTDERWANCYIKSINLLPNIIAKDRAVAGGHDEAIFVRDGHVTEGSSSNVFAVKGGALHTPPVTHWILNGITRMAVVKLAGDMDIRLHEEDFRPEWLVSADEAFITSTTAEVLPIRAIDDKPIGEGRPGPVTKKLLAAFRDQTGSLISK